MKKYAVIVGVSVLILAGLWAVDVRIAEAPEGRACTQEAKLCPDGSSVGRTGPNCEFAQCPVSEPGSLLARIGQEVSGLGVGITPLAVLEDSRCPIDVQCIQAGTVRLRARLISGLGTATQEFTIGRPITTEGETVTLVDVLPQPRAGVEIKESEYVFRFNVAKREENILPYNSGVRGSVLLGPTCPVERIPPDPGCADRPYETKISVYRTGSDSIFATGNSDTKGEFEFSLPPGSYTLKATGGSVLPRCSDADVVVGPTGYTAVTISCDTGIR
ncbi:MAG: hypothetical protein Q7S05_02715 [bacterium]|nr:hypothetical protein [bacterium]